VPVVGDKPKVNKRRVVITVIMINGINTINHDIMPKPF
jgi:hypothetical protein